MGANLHYSNFERKVMPSIDFNFVEEQAKGKWPEILEGMGVPSELLNPNKHHPCPNCGGKDRFRFTNAHGTGWFICNQCGQGGGFKLVSMFFNCNYREAVIEVAKFLNLIDSNTGYKNPVSQMRKIEVKNPSVSPKVDKQAALLAIWEKARPVEKGDPVELYLQSREIDWEQIKDHIQEIRFLENYDYWLRTDDVHKPYKVGEFPCMVVAIRGADGVLNGLHFTYLQAVEAGYQKLDMASPLDETPLPAKKIKSRFQSAISGSAAHLFESKSDVLCIAEGLETAMAAFILYKQPVWACLTANGIKMFQVPEGIRKVVVFADNDANFTGITAAEEFKKHLEQTKPDVDVKIYLPNQTGYDMLDVLIERNF